MKIVQSFWSKPSRIREGQDPTTAGACGWADKKYNYFSWALSCLQFRKYYDEVELVTDKAGYELLIDKLELPYSHTRVILDDLNDYHADLWAIGKVYTYSLQKAPFIHADGDVIIWAKFDEELENASLLCQCKEEGHPFDKTYAGIFRTIEDNFEYRPEILQKSIDRNGSIMSVNAGIIGGCDITFFKEYAAAAFEFIDRNVSHLSRISVGLFNIIFEQFFFRALSEEKGLEIRYYDAGSHLSDDYTGIPSRTRYIHRPGKWKWEKYFTSCMEYRLLTDYPDHYFKILNLLKTSQI
jgi:hypothetical protein